MSIYSFLIAVRSGGEMLTNEDGETTSHLMGMFYRTLRIVDNGIKPVYVFDGAPPKLKSGELAKRFQRKAEATEGLEEAKETGTAEDVEKFSRRTVRVTREHNAECQRLLKLMGVPYIIAPTEAEAQCAVLARAGKVYAAASEDMDTLCFDSPVLLRHLTFSEQRKEPIQEIFLDKVLTGLDMDRKQVFLPYFPPSSYLFPMLHTYHPYDALPAHLVPLAWRPSCSRLSLNPERRDGLQGSDSVKASGASPAVPDPFLVDCPIKSSKTKLTNKFVDLCILLGCDYLDPIPKVGPHTALKLIREYGTLEKFVDAIKAGKAKFTLPEDWPFADARELFFNPDVRPADHADCDFKWEAPDTEGLVKFLVEEKGFSEDRVRSGASRLTKNLKSTQQARLEGFFKPIPKTEEEIKSLKRKNEEKNEAKKKKLKEEKKEKKVAKAKPRGTA
jgi:5'-3' exonuclease